MSKLITFMSYEKYLSIIKMSHSNFEKVFDLKKVNFNMQMLTLRDSIRKDDIKGIPFLLRSLEASAMIKIYPIDKDYDNSYSEMEICKLFSKEILLKNISPCIVYFYKKHNNINNNSVCFKGLPLKEMEKEFNIEKHSNILATEYVNGKDLFTWERDQKYIVPDNIWANIIFQVVYTLAVLQDHYKFCHNDLSPSNILVNINDMKTGYFKFIYKQKEYYLKREGILCKLWDYEFSSLYKPSCKIINNMDFTRKFNKFKDLHFFLNNLLGMNLPDKTRNFILSLYPEHLLNNYSKEELSEYPSYFDDSDSESDDEEYDDTSSIDIFHQLNWLTGDKYDLYYPEKLLEHAYFKEFILESGVNLFVDQTFSYK